MGEQVVTETQAKRGPAPHYTLRQRLGYRFDAALSRGPSIVIGWLGLLTLAVIVISAIVLTITRLTGVNGGDRLPLGEALWQSMLRVVDAGTFAGDSGWWSRLLGLLVTLAGIFIAGSLIGLIASAVDQRIEALRKGRSTVLEHGHTLILGWSDRVPAIVSELVLANESLKRAAIVVLANEDKVMMEETLRDAIDDFRTTKLVCRSGHTSAFADLALVNVEGARSIVVIGGNDASVVKTLLAMRHLGTSPDVPIVAELIGEDAAISIRALFDQQVLIVNSDAVVAELTAQACRQRGLSQVFRELLDFDGDEIYFEVFPELVGTSFGTAHLLFEKSSLLGLVTADGNVVLNPPSDRVLAAGDELIGIASDDSTFVVGHAITPQELETRDHLADDGHADRRIILVGWSQLGPRVVAELDEFLGASTTVEIIVDPDIHDPIEVRQSFETETISIEVRTVSGRPEQIAQAAASRAFHEVIVLGRRIGLSAEEADAATLLTLMAFSQLPHSDDIDRVRIVAELLEQRHAPLAVATGADDFIVSDELTSLMIAQLSEDSTLDRVFRVLFDRGGATIQMVPAPDYGVTTRAGTFADVVAAATVRNQCAIGYRRHEDGEVVVNPDKNAALRLDDLDAIVVLS
jgi:voltage-gated potassium channel Kch